MKQNKGISQIWIMVIMLILAIALPITANLVQKSQENRSKATETYIKPSLDNVEVMLGGYPDVWLVKVTCPLCHHVGIFDGTTYKQLMTEVSDGIFEYQMDATDTTTGLVDGIFYIPYKLTIKGCSIDSQPYGNQCFDSAFSCFKTISNGDGTTNITTGLPLGTTTWTITEDCSNPISCTPNQEYCATQTTKHICNSSGNGWLTSTDCSNCSQLGVGSTVTCPATPNQCDSTTPSPQCSGNNLRTCVGNVWIETSCSYGCIGKSIAEGSGGAKCVDCEEISQKCVDGNKYNTCSNGAWSTTTSDCINGKTCTSGSISLDVCQIKTVDSTTCVAGQKKCTAAGDKSVTCGADFLWPADSTGVACSNCVENGGTVTCGGTPGTPTTCAESNWTSTLSPTVCPSTSQQTKTWTKTGTCTGGVTHPASETVACTYNPSTPTCTAANWTTFTLTPAVCDATGQQTKTFTKTGTCEGGVGQPASQTVTCCTTGTKRCDTSDTTNRRVEQCSNNTWSATTPCNSTQLCTAGGICQAASSVDAVINVKMAFAGVKPSNDQCVTDIWPISLRINDSQGVNVLGTQTFQGPPTKTTAVNTKGEIVYSFTGTILDIPSNGATDLAFFIKGPKHKQVKYGENNQSSYYNLLVGKLPLVAGQNNYDFSNYSLLAGDVTGATSGVPNGVIDENDFSFIKNLSQPITQGASGTSVVGDIDGNCQVNAGDVRLIKESLIRIYDQTY